MRIPVLLLALAATLSCNEVVPSNRFDPTTPPEQQASGAITGRLVLDDGGATIVGTVVGLTDRKGQRVTDGNGVPREIAVTPAPGDGGAFGAGTFRIPDVKPGQYVLWVKADARFLAPRLPEVNLLPGDELDVGELRFTRLDVGTGRIRGKVELREAQGGPREVSLHRRVGAGTQVLSKVRTESNGSFDLQRLPPGTYAISAELTGFTPDFGFDLVLTEEPGALGSEVVLEGERALVLHPLTAVLVPALERQFGRFYTNARELPLLVLAFGGMTEMRLSADPRFLDPEGADIAYEPYTAAKTVTLPDTEGTQRVYAQFRARHGEFEFTSDLYETEVVRDATPPQVQGVNVRGLRADDDGITWLRESGATVTLEVQGNDAESAVASYAVHTDATNGSGSPEALTFRSLDAPGGYMRVDHTLDLFPGQGPKVAAVYLRDRAGNTSAPRLVELVVDSEPPALQEGATLRVVNANQQGELDSRLAKVEILQPPECRATPPTAAAGVCAVAMRAGPAPISATLPWVPFATAEDATVDLAVTGGNGQSVGFAVELRDQAGNTEHFESPLYTLRLLGRLSGRVLVEGWPEASPAHGGVVVRLYEPGGDRTTPVASAITSADGTFSLRTATDDPSLASSRLPAGHYLVSCARDDLDPFEAETDVRENEDGVLPSYRVTPARGNLRGNFVRADLRTSRVAHGGIEVTAQRGGIVVARTVTAEDGSFAFPSPGLPVTTGADRYTITAGASGYASRRLDGVQVARDATTVLVPDGATPPEPTQQELARLSGDFVFCEALTGDCIPTPYTKAATVRVKLLDSTGVTDVRVASTAFAPDANTPAWTAFSATVLPTVTIPTTTQGPVDVYVQAKVAGTAGPVLRATVIYDRTPPTITGFSLEDGAGALAPGFTHLGTVRANVLADAGAGDVAPLQSAFVAFADTAPATPPSGATACAFASPCPVALPRTGSVIAEKTHLAWAYACDRAGNCSTASGAKIVFDATAPRASNGLTFVPSAAWITSVASQWFSRTARVQVKIGAGTAKTASGTAVLDTTGSPVAEVLGWRFGLKPDLSDAAWVSAATRPAPGSFSDVAGPTLTGEDGTYRIYAQFADAAGNTTDLDTSPPSFDLVLDTTPPAVTFALNNGATWATSPDVTLGVTVAASDPGPARTVFLATDGGLFQTGSKRNLPLTGTDGTFTLPATAAPAGDGPYSVYARFTDAAGNASDRAATVWLDRTKPSLASLSCASCRVGPTGSLATKDRVLLLDVVALDNSGQIGSVSTAIDGAAATVAPYTGTLAPTLPNADGSHTVTVIALDPAGNASAPQSLTIMLDRVVPTSTLTLEGGAPYTRTATVSATVSNPDGQALDGMRVSNTATFSGGVQPFASTFTWALGTPGTDGPRTVYLELTDPAGNVRTTSASITLDATPPTPPRINPPASAVSATTWSLALASASTDVTSAPVRYEWLLPGASTWAAVTPPSNVTLARNTTSRYRLRAVDSAGNVSAEDQVTLVQDDLPPPKPTIVTPVTYVPATTTSVTLGGSESDATFLRYQTCTAPPTGAACPTTCAFSPNSPTFALPLDAGTQTCLLARAIDDAGNTSPVASVLLTSDLRPPNAPTLAPEFQPGQLTVRSPFVDLFITEPATDPVGTGPTNGAAWAGIAYLEIDTGSGYAPICQACQVAGAWDPCGCGCSDARVRCLQVTDYQFPGQSNTLSALRLPLQPARATSISVRAVDLAGNRGDGRTVVVNTAGSTVLTNDVATQWGERISGTLLTYLESQPGSSTARPMVVDLGANRLRDDTDPACSLAPATPLPPIPSANHVLYYDPTIGFVVADPGQDGIWCTHDDVSAVQRGPATNVVDLAFSFPRFAWMEQLGRKFTLLVRDGTNEYPVWVRTANAASPAELQLAGTTLSFRWFNEALTPGGLWQYALLTPRSNWLDTARWDFPSNGFFQSTRNMGLALAPDGRSVFTPRSNPDGSVWSPAQLVVRQVGRDGVYGTADDSESTPLDLAPPRVPRSYGGRTSWSAAFDGSHATTFVSVVNGLEYFADWTTGPDGKWGTADDVVNTQFPSAAGRGGPVVSGGLAVYDRQGDLLALDLSLLRWESVALPMPLTGWPVEDNLTTPILNGKGGLFAFQHTNQGHYWHFRTSDGRESVGRWYGSGGVPNGLAGPAAATGDEFLVGNGTGNSANLGVWALVPDSGGRFFTPSAPAPHLVLAGNVKAVAAGDGKAYATTYDATTYQHRAWVIEPRTASAATGPRLYDVTCTSNPGSCVDLAAGSSYGPTYVVPFGGVSAVRAAWPILGSSGQVEILVRDAGADATFGTADDEPVKALEDSFCPSRECVPNVVRFPRGANDDGTRVFVAGHRLAIADATSRRLLVVDPPLGATINHVNQRILTVPTPTGFSGVSFAGDKLAFTAGGQGGTQVFVYDVVTQALFAVTQHFSPKGEVAMDATGRIVWTDALFPYWSLFSLQQ